MEGLGVAPWERRGLEGGKNQAVRENTIVTTAMMSSVFPSVK